MVWGANQGTNAGVTIDWDGGFDIGADEYPPREWMFLPVAQKARYVS